MKIALWITGVLFIVTGMFIYLVTSLLSAWAILFLSSGLLFVVLWVVLYRREIQGAFSVQKAFYGFNVIVLVAVVLGIVSVINYVSTDYYKRWDLTSNRQYTLSQETRKVLGGLRQGLTIKAFFQEGTGMKIRDLLAEYAYLSRHVHYEVIDPDKEPTIAKSYGITSSGTIVLQYGTKTVKIEQSTENGITNAIIKLLSARVINVCYITGNGERDLADTSGVEGYGLFKQALIDQDYTVTPLLLPAAASIPTSCTLVVDAGAVKPFLSSELGLLDDYLKAGGYLFVMMDPLTRTGLSKFLSKYGIVVGDNVVLDQVVRLFQGPALGVEPVVTQYSKVSDITKNFKGTTIFPLVRSVDKERTANSGTGILSIARTSNTSWTDVHLKKLFSKGIAKFGPGDVKGPISVAVAGTLTLGNRVARIAVFGTSKIATNKYITALFNKDLVMNTVSWLVEEGNLVTIRSRPNKGQQMFLTVVQGKLIFYLTVVLIPAMLFFFGVLAYMRMKRL
ncbi:MAG: GldG family protein [Deltaproteobacteria bacterium]|nr:GldG family protein [Deltaproteobacteria bacterium]MCL5276426.1 GldG family protein [Deltaproteobacteria bacterium]